ncbi:uncharacterized protein LOC110683063 [Chenopodium quinoa]|uniref:uncharacterized protein LOC110683063 n=1 Tax=Chenopodium quinoa TaxID=63459 RepID=UPI000B774730|nr:uncharacterized protein LOC110683063 [Chenopodium quinoa]
MEWNKISQAFHKVYFPPEKTEKIRHQISTFSQESGESLREAWDRFLDLQRSCPHHNLEKWNLVCIFYNGLEPETKCIIDSAVGGVFLDKTIEEGYDFLTNLAPNHFSSPRTRVKKGKMEVEAYSILTSQLTQLTAKIDALQATQDSSLGHFGYQCAQNSQDTNQIEQQQLSQPQNPQPQQYAARPPLNQQGASHHAPSGFNTPPQQPTHGNARTQDPTMFDLIRMMTSMMQNTEDSIKELKNTTKNLENQIAQVVGTNIQRQPGHLPG